MKNIILKSAGILTVLLLATGISSFVSAQQTNVRFRTGERPMMANQVEKLKLTEDQQKQMAELRAKFQEETLQSFADYKFLMQFNVNTLLEVLLPNSV